MPTYGYRCTECGNEYDVWQRMSDEPVAACPACGKSGKRLIFPAGIVFKGTGFYKTDSRKSGSDGTSSTSSTSSSGSETKTATPSSGSGASTSPSTSSSTSGGD